MRSLAFIAAFALGAAFLPTAASAAVDAPSPAVAGAEFSASPSANPEHDTAAFLAAAAADRDAREAAAAAEAARIAAEAEAARLTAEQAAADAAAADAAAAEADADAVAWVEEEPVAESAPAAEPVAEAPAESAPAPQPTEGPREDDGCGPCPGATLVWYVYEGEGYWACPAS